MTHIRVRMFLAGLVVASASAIAGCSGDNGQNGDPGAPGQPCWDLNDNGVADPEEDTNGDGVVDVLDCRGENEEGINEACPVCHSGGRIADVAALHPGLQTFEDVEASIDGVVIDVDDDAATATLTVNFTVTDSQGDPIRGLAAPSSSRPDRFAYLRFALAELEPAAEGSGDADVWINYTRGDRNPENLTDHGDGTYAYVFDANLYDLYDPGLRHRLLLIVFGDIVEQSKDVTYDFVPEQLPGPFNFDARRDIVATEACNACHGRLGSPLGSASFHGGSRYLTEACVVCHTTTLADGEAEFGPMIHGIHTGRVFEELGDFSDVTYPQDIRNCAKCHAGADGDHWNTRPTMTACGSCHRDVDFATGDGHPIGGVQEDNQLCAQCHPPTGNIAPIVPAHLTENSTPNNPDVPGGLVNFEYVLEEVTVNANNEPVVKFHINVDGEPLDLSTYPPVGFSRGPTFLVAYALPQDGVDEPADYNNLGRSAGQPASVSLASVAGNLAGSPESYTVNLSDAPFPEGATMRAVALQGYFTQLAAGEGDEDVARHTPSVVMPVTGDAVRRQVVEVAKCLGCHEILELHGGNRVNQVQVCVLCHNPNLSSSGRTADPAGVPPATVEALGPDPLTYPETAMVFKQLVHGIHSAAKRTFPLEFVRNRNGGIYYNFSEVTFPGILSNCETCHAPGTYDPGLLPVGVLVSTDMTTDGVNASRDDLIAARDSVPNDTDLVNSPVASACYACHNSNLVAAHMGQNGGVIDAERAASIGE
jgi:OmcA/MtrC family decaheme c-type cytochrome